MKVTYIELAKQKHPLCFSLAASEKLTKAFGGLDKMADGLIRNADEKQSVDAVDTVLGILLDAGRIYIAACGEEPPPKITCRPSDLIDVRDTTIMQVIMEAMSEGTKREVEIETKNGEATQTP